MSTEYQNSMIDPEATVELDIYIPDEASFPQLSRCQDTGKVIIEKAAVDYIKQFNPHIDTENIHALYEVLREWYYALKQRGYYNGIAEAMFEELDIMDAYPVCNRMAQAALKQ